MQIHREVAIGDVDKWKPISNQSRILIDSGRRDAAYVSPGVYYLHIGSAKSNDRRCDGETAEFRFGGPRER